MAAPLLPLSCYRYLGGSGVKVSTICLGTGTFGSVRIVLSYHGYRGTHFFLSEDKEFQIRAICCDEAASHKILDRFVELGGNFIDTANFYGKGTTETIVGNWLAKQQRHKIILASKVRMQMEDDNLNSGGLSRMSIMWSVDESLKRLKTDYLDLFQIHAWDWGTPLEETLRTLDDLVRAGKVRYIGASDVTSWQLQKIIDYSRFMGLNKWVTLQTQYSLMVREPESEYLDVCKIEGVGLLPWSPLKGQNEHEAVAGSSHGSGYIAPGLGQCTTTEHATVMCSPGGWLSGKIKKGDKAAPEGSRIAWSEAMGDKISYQSCPKFGPYANNEGTWNLLGIMENIAKETGKSVAQVALRWLLQKEAVSSVIIGCKTIAQLEDNMGAGAGWELTAEQMSALDDASAVPPLQVAELIKWMNVNRPRKDWTQ